jgi:hypothetical protein
MLLLRVTLTQRLYAGPVSGRVGNPSSAAVLYSIVAFFEGGQMPPKKKPPTPKKKVKQVPKPSVRRFPPAKPGEFIHPDPASIPTKPEEY